MMIVVLVLSSLCGRLYFFSFSCLRGLCACFFPLASIDWARAFWRPNCGPASLGLDFVCDQPERAHERLCASNGGLARKEKTRQQLRNRPKRFSCATNTQSVKKEKKKLLVLFFRKRCLGLFLGLAQRSWRRQKPTARSVAANTTAHRQRPLARGNHEDGQFPF
ncbi:hypothetical protein TW95_gp0332 [Pandoravirus inopinatum]|uniref:Uncharacterized protein n=1 Tax=Pandoravirus inopinatum TaxID=1605721 RepID=A0A0B5J8E5_9VIRU|nr:hypothetical protein TW95_gp0332 [Pandoravirus inopinatum]AJF97066.1 hypothetical protein [Pandoravirus inopinatum]